MSACKKAALWKVSLDAATNPTILPFTFRAPAIQRVDWPYGLRTLTAVIRTPDEHSTVYLTPCTYASVILLA